MINARPFGYNNGAPILGTLQFGNLVVGDETDLPYSDNYGGIKWWNGPNEELGYVIAQTNVDSNGNPQQPAPGGTLGSVGFFRTLGFNTQQYVNLASVVANQTFTGATQAKTWLLSNGYWTSFEGSFRLLAQNGDSLKTQNNNYLNIQF